eukprot:Nitzschia sp. Nitz4//scaffold12_size214221//105393//106187//NITZ4_001503-RA/size214221-processed-gene-0.119-mRNA-1//1//CDS//3329535029//3384//frame0
MGKKKSKVAKQKQNKAKGSNKNSSALATGVLLTKGRSNKRANAGVSAMILDAGNSSSRTTKHKLKGSSSAKGSSWSGPPTTANVPQTTPSPSNEQAEFARQLASMQERHAASKNSGVQKKKSVLLQEGAVTNLVENFSPASFAVEKTTTDLLMDTVRQMKSMTGVGHQTADSLKTPIRTNQTWAVPKKATSLPSNPFAALDEEDSDNEGAPSGNKDLQWNVPTLQLAPASFSLLPRTTPTPAPTPRREISPLQDMGNDDIDPDL